MIINTIKNKYMTQPLYLLGLCFISAFLAPSCSTETSAQDTRVVAKVNNYELTLSEYEAKLVQELEYDRSYKSTAGARKEFLDRLIRQEILIQEAVNMNLDKNPSFVTAIEKYWEATLIKTLMEAKMTEVRQKTFVTDEEIKARYIRLKTGNPNLLPLDQVEKEIAARIKEEKSTAAVGQWINRLEKGSKIKIYDQYL